MLINLPQEILLLIAEYLEQEHAYSILDLACVSKHFYSYLMPRILRTLKFSMNDFAQLAEDVQQYHRILQRVHGYRHVHRLIIRHDIKAPEVDDEVQPEPQEQSQKQPWRRPRLSAIEFSDHFDDILDNCMRELYYRGTDLMPLKAVYDTNDSWKPLATFISQITSLECLFYDGLSQLPPFLLECLHQCQPHCRLYVNQFELRSLTAHGTDDYEYSLASSPCLYGLTFLRGGLATSFPGRGYDDEALECMVAGLAPNLKRLHVLRTRSITRPRLHEPRIPWAGFAQQTVTDSRGALECFSPSNWPWLEKETLETWENITSFSALKRLILDSKCFATASSEHLAAKCYFPSLTNVEIDLGPVFDTTRYHSSRVAAINSFMLNLPSLSDLKLDGWHPRIAVDMILANHGSRLQHLSLLSLDGRTLSLENLNLMAETCISLEKLAVQVKRSRGSYEEFRRYQVLGLLPRLRHLDLKLDASNQSLWNQERSEDEDDDDYVENEDEIRNARADTPSDLTFNEFDNQYSCFHVSRNHYVRNGHIRDAFVNGALDRNLAYDIYQAICSIRQSEEGNHFLPLVSMNVEVTGACLFSHWKRPIAGIFDYLGRPCSVKRIIGSDGNPEIIVEEPLLETPKYSRGSGVVEMGEWLQTIYRGVWPAKSSNWWEDWHSFPLAKSVDEEIDWKSR